MQRAATTPALTTIDTQPVDDLLARLEHWLGYQPDVRHVQHLAHDAVQVDVYGVGVVHLTVHRPGA